uniref:EMAP like 1 n=1 Tax=Hucho hucho TaxID=62062 RepID=A0A4W5R584_9TELE
MFYYVVELLAAVAILLVLVITTRIRDRHHDNDSASAASSMEVMDRIASLEQRVQMQEDEIQLLKSALADVVRRLNISEEQNAMINRRGPTKARPMMTALPLRHTVNNGTVLPKKSCGTLLSPTGSRKDAAAPETKSLSSLSGITTRLIYITSPHSTVRRTNSNETMGTLTRKDSGDSKSNRTRTGSTGSNSSGKRASESKLKEPVFNAGMRRVTHCKVTVQIYLAHPSKRTRTAEAPKSNAAAVSGRCSAPPTAPDSKSASDKSVKSNGVRKTPTFALPLRKSVRQSSYTPYSPLDKPSYRSPIKSPSQYFQICY